ncbi:patatin-like phospholipase family protein [Rhizobium leguminosarum]|uniref:patatin-like phospholipase family protein n=1 Tax=Rhizobium leguminosarum TaxID=384 RepID=UPI001C955228|nr:patatin-like phospholipase family protein [Rhizobium leguminosarum]MBY5794992.1 patatin-like phospholipase family protein [Rhizobium leguminosarum]
MLEENPKSIALCLSGGGLRATFFHLGVIRALRKLGLLDRTKFVFSVSGGSILAAHLVLNWSKYCADGATSAQIERELVQFGRRDLRGRVVRRWILLGWTLLLPKHLSKLRLGPMQFLEREYRRLFRGSTFGDIVQNEPKAPVLHVLSTNLNNGSLCSFSKDGYSIEVGEKDQQSLFEHESIPLSLAVTASSAFPPLFPPVQLENKMFSVDIGKFRYSPHLLTDGGVFDNLGFEKAKLLETRGELPVDLIVISDAGGPFDWNIKSTFFWPVSRSIRTADILMNRIAVSTLLGLKARGAGDKTLVCSIEDNTERGATVEVQNQLRYVRTDLDAFSETEVDQLARHGENVAIEKFEARLGKPISPLEETEPKSKSATSLKEALDRSPERRWGVFNRRDPASYALAALVLLVPGALAYQFMVKPQYIIERQEAAATSASSEGTSLLNKVLSLQETQRALQGSLKEAAETISKLKMQNEATPAPCRDPSHGIEKSGKSEMISRPSGWVGGGSNPTAWCNNLISDLKPDYSPDTVFTVVSTSEASRSSCKPFNCAQYQYFCTVQVNSEPVYFSKVSPACTVKAAATKP